ncbi:MAG: thermonuclease family protein, partial [SAR324 cluster bacterium]|nr:thermonuclease family protein [SAR324 cluster bacterium]
RNVRVDYDYSEKLYRMEGTVWSGDTNLNLWMIRNGWSYYLLPDEQPVEHEELIAAEKEARQKQVGLWKAELQQ